MTHRIHLPESADGVSHRHRPRSPLAIATIGVAAGIVLGGCVAAAVSRQAAIPEVPAELLEAAISNRSGLCSKLGGKLSQCTAPPRPKLDVKVEWPGLQPKDGPTHVICRLNRKTEGDQPLWECVPLYLDWR